MVKSIFIYKLILGNSKPLLMRQNRTSTNVGLSHLSPSVYLCPVPEVLDLVPHDLVRQDPPRGVVVGPALDAVVDDGAPVDGAVRPHDGARVRGQLHRRDAAGRAGDAVNDDLRKGATMF